MIHYMPNLTNNFRWQLKEVEEIEDEKTRIKEEIKLFKQHFGEDYLNGWRIYNAKELAIDAWEILLDEMEL